jgi:hypothetical protein
MALVEEAVDEDEDDVAAGVHPASGGVCFRKRAVSTTSYRRLWRILNLGREIVL